MEEKLKLEKGMTIKMVNGNTYIGSIQTFDGCEVEVQNIGEEKRICVSFGVTFIYYWCTKYEIINTKEVK